MQVYIKEIPEDKNYIILEVYNSAKRHLYDIKFPKYFLAKNEDEELNVGDNVQLSLKKAGEL